jgi:hypothetical protein
MGKKRKVRITSSYLITNYKGKYVLQAEVDKNTGDFCRDKDGNLDNYNDIWIVCDYKGRIFHFGGKILEFYCPSLGRGHNILKAIYQEYIGSIDKFVTTSTAKRKDGKEYESSRFDYEAMYDELKDSNGIIFEAYDTDEEVLFKFKANNLDRLVKYIKPREVRKPKKEGKEPKGSSPFAVKHTRKKCVIPIEKLAEYKKITSCLGKDNLIVYNEINKGFLADLRAKLHMSEDSFKSDFKAWKTKEYIYSKGEKVWNDYMIYIKNYLNSMEEK